MQDKSLPIFLLKLILAELKESEKVRVRYWEKEDMVERMNDFSFDKSSGSATIH